MLSFLGSLCTWLGFSQLKRKHSFWWHGFQLCILAAVTFRRGYQLWPWGRAGRADGRSLGMWQDPIKIRAGTSLVAQWLGIHPPMQGTQVQSPAREDSTCHGAAKLMRSYWSPRTLEPMLSTTKVTAVRRPSTATRSSPRSPQLERARVQQWRPSAAKHKYK